MSDQTWDEQRVQVYIDNQIEESFNLEYKAAAKLIKSNSRTDDVTKVVSAMANSAGGIVIFGIAENQTHKHLPERIDPVDRNACPREHLEQIINNIQPKLDAYSIHSVQIGECVDRVVYVVDVPQSHTAHQATDKKYYRRHGSISEPMADYEIRDVMGRSQHPRIALYLTISRETVENSQAFPYFPGERERHPATFTDVYHLVPLLKNEGSILAQYVTVKVSLPNLMRFRYVPSTQDKSIRFTPEVLDDYVTLTLHNTTRDRIKGGGGFAEEYGPARYVPVLPDVTIKLDYERLAEHIRVVEWGERTIRWKVHADNAPVRRGEVAIEKLIARIQEA